MPATESAAKAIAKISYTHDAMIDLIINEPQLSQQQVAERFGYTAAWVNRVFCSDAFQARLAARRKEIVDPTLVASVEERLKGLSMLATDVITEKLAATRNTDLAMKALEVSSRALSFGARKDNLQGSVFNFVVALPPKIVDANEWAAQHAGRTIEQQ